MKRMVSLLLCLVMALWQGIALAEGTVQGETEAIAWGHYMIKATWLTTDREQINVRDLRTDGLIVMIRLQPTEGKIALDDIKNMTGGEFVLVNNKKEKANASTWIVHQFSDKKADNGFPEIAQEQDSFELLFFFKGRKEKVLEGAKLTIEGSEGTIELDNVPREKPET